MYVDFNDLPETSRIWIYQSDKELEPQQIEDMREVFERGDICPIIDFQRNSVSITLGGDIAHVMFDGLSTQSSGRVETTLETRVMERSGGVWRILFASFLLRGHQQIDANRLAVNAISKTGFEDHPMDQTGCRTDLKAKTLTFSNTTMPVNAAVRARSVPSGKSV